MTLFAFLWAHGVDVPLPDLGMEHDRRRRQALPRLVGREGLNDIAARVARSTEASADQVRQKRVKEAKADRRRRDSTVCFERLHLNVGELFFFLVLSRNRIDQVLP